MMLAQTRGTRSTLLVGSTSRPAAARAHAPRAQPERQRAAQPRNLRVQQAPGAARARALKVEASARSVARPAQPP
jgi:hypothetical protein